MTAAMSTAANVSWDLSDLYAAVDDPRIDADLAAVKELESLSEQMDRSGVYAGLLHAAQTADPRHGALLAKTREKRTAINKHLIFFDLEWVALDDAAATKLLDAPELARYRHWL